MSSELNYKALLLAVGFRSNLLLDHDDEGEHIEARVIWYWRNV
jgi:hypothetical protein